MQSKIILILLLSIATLVSCETEMIVTEQNLLGIWKEIESNNIKPKESRGILISKMNSGLYEEEIVILNNNHELNYSIFSDGCFISLKGAKKNEQNLTYTCLSGEVEHSIKMFSKKLSIGKRRFKRYSN